MNKQYYKPKCSCSYCSPELGAIWICEKSPLYIKLTYPETNNGFMKILLWKLNTWWKQAKADYNDSQINRVRHF